MKHLFEFKINKFYLLAHIIASGHLPQYEKFLQKFKRKYPKEWRRTQNKFWKLTKDKNDPGFFIIEKISSLKNFELENLFKGMMETKEFRKILKETEINLEKTKKEWFKNQIKTKQEFEKITKLKIENIKTNVFITHPSLPNGRNFPSKNAIGWRYRLDWPNYNTVYLMHELLHLITYKKFKEDSVMHAVIELATDNELRMRLNKKGRYFEIKGHSQLLKFEKKIYPFWQKYLKNNKENIIQFNKRMEKLF